MEKSFTNSIGMLMVRIEPGEFSMGSETPPAKWDESPIHKVTITQPFYMSEVEVTEEQFRQFRADFTGTEEYSPYAAGVSWYDAMDFCEWLSKKEGKPYRLPTEAEWEYACLAGSETKVSAGEELPEPDVPNAWGPALEPFASLEGKLREGIVNAFPFQWTSSTDNGTTLSEIKFPDFKNEVGKHSKQPINTAFRGPDGTMYIPSDAGTSVLWVSRNNGNTWFDPGGRTGGRHTTFVLLRDGSILGMGGKNTDIDGFMPKSISHDGGKTWEVSKTQFCCLGANQRPSILRLQSGRLFFAGDFQRIDGFQPEGISQRGAYVALSEDEGKTWRVKKLIGAQVHENPKRAEVMQGATLGYSVARQAPNGVIHLITTMNRPCLHFEMNEAWILNERRTEEIPDLTVPRQTDEELMKSSATTISNVGDYEEKHPNGRIKATWQAGIADDGRYLLHGTETWFYPNGKKQREANYRLGYKVGEEIYWSSDGKRLWRWEYRDDGSSVWTQWWPNGQKKAESTWRF